MCLEETVDTAAHTVQTLSRSIQEITLLGWLRITYNGTTPENQAIILSKFRARDTKVRNDSRKNEPEGEMKSNRITGTFKEHKIGLLLLKDEPGHVPWLCHI